MTYPRVRKRTESKATLLLREQGGGAAGSNPVIPTSVYKERPSRGRSYFLSSGPCPGRIAALIGSLESF